MLLMTRFLFLLFLFTTQISFAQLNKLDKAKLLNILKESVHQTNTKKIDTDSNPWLICNKDSNFFKADTLYLFDNINYYYQPENCCDFVGWTFYKGNAFVQRDIQICNEPPTAKILKDKDFYTTKVEEDNNEIVLKVYRKKQLLDTYAAIDFRVVGLSQKNQKSNQLTLVRKNN